MAKQIFRTSPEEMARMGITEKIEIREDGMRTDPDRGFFEWWYFDAHLEDGSTVVIVYMTTSIMEYNGPMKPGILLNVTKPDGVKLEASPVFTPRDFTASREQCDVKIGPNTVKGNLQSYELHAEGENLAADLKFTGIAPPWRPGDGKAFFGDMDHYFAWLPSIPYGRVEGTLSYDGNTYTVKGSGYHDHNWGNVSLPRVMDHWFWGRSRVKDYTLIFVEQLTHRRYGYSRRPVFYLAKGDKILTGDGDNLTLKTEDTIKHPGGREYPLKLDFHWKSEENTVHISLRNPELIEATSLLSRLPFWKRKLFRLFANPYYFRFNSEMVLDIDFGKIKAHEEGSSLYELMQLN